MKQLSYFIFQKIISLNFQFRRLYFLRPRFNFINFYKIIFGVALLSFPNLLLAGIEITEIMYDVEGTDSGREWIEIHNAGSEGINLSGWKLYENETNHKINLVSESDSFTISAGGYAIIADNPEKFLIDYSSYSGAIFDSAFSLKNSGEEIIIRDAELNDIDSVFYDTELGASGDGNSLQKINNLFEAKLPTPGTLNSGQTQQDEQNQSSEDTSSTYIPPEDLPARHASQLAGVAGRPKIKADAGQNKTVVVGATNSFDGLAYGFENEILEDARYLWNFGEGTTKEGKSVGHNYKYTGEYLVVLEVSVGSYSGKDTIVVNVIPNEIIISEIKTGEQSFVELKNNSKQALDISGWRLKHGYKYFNFPQNTFIKAKGYLVVSAEISDLFLNEGQGQIDFLYPNNFVADSFKYEGLLKEEQSFSKNGDESIKTESTPGGENKIVLSLGIPEINTSESTKESTKTVSIPHNSVEIKGSRNGIAEEKQSLGKNQTSNIVNSVSKPPESNKLYYFLGVLVLVIFSIFGVTLIRRQSSV